MEPTANESDHMSQRSQASAASNIASVIEGKDPSALALVEGEIRLTYGELADRVSKLRARLSGSGLGPGGRVMLIGENEIDFVVGALASLGVGASVCPARSRNPLPELQRKFVSIEPTLTLLCATADWLLPHLEELDSPEVYRVGGSGLEGSADRLPEDSLTIDSGIVERSDDDLAFLLLTSGVTSDAKVAMLSHGNLSWVQRSLTADPAIGMNSDDVALGALPMTHIFGLNVVLLTTLRAGGIVVLQPKFDPVEGLKLIRDHGVTVLSGAPPMWHLWTEGDAPSDALSTVRHAASGAAALPRSTFDAVHERFGLEVAEGYGLTETAPLVTWSRGVATRAGSVGKPVPGVDIVLVEEDGTPVEQGDTGEIVVRSPGVFKGYLEADDLTDAVLTEDGWFWTGDIGVFDSDGYLYLVDRIKDIIIVSGFNVYPAEVEGVLLTHPSVRGAIVVGTPNALTGEEVVAHVSGEVDTHELDAWCRSQMSTYKCPGSYHVVDELPVASNGKKIRRAVR